jgi:hypothetical protein
MQVLEKLSDSQLASDASCSMQRCPYKVAASRI